MRRAWFFVSIAFLLMAVALLACSRLLPAIEEASWEGAEETAGQVVGFAQSDSGNRPLVSFMAHDGYPYVFEADTETIGFRTGQMVTVRYFLTPDLRASIQEKLPSTIFVFDILGCVLLVAGLVLLFLYLRAVSAEKLLLQYGVRIFACVTGIIVVRHAMFNGRHPYIVTCQYRDPQGIGERPATSGWIDHLPSGLKVGDTIPVLIDPYRPGHFLILDETHESAVS